jgi:glucose-1-phosphate thymidylyltransferase
MIEKPDNPPTNLAITGIYHFKSSERLFNSIEYIIKEKIKTRNEYQLTDAMKHMMYGGEKFQVFDVSEWYDCGAKESLLATNEIMLARYGTNDNITGNIIIPPVFVGKDCVVENSIIGPNVSLANNATVRNSIVKSSVLGIGSTVENTILDSSIIGDYAYLHQAAMEFNIGPDSEIIFTN